MKPSAKLRRLSVQEYGSGARNHVLAARNFWRRGGGASLFSFFLFLASNSDGDCTIPLFIKKGRMRMI